MGRPPISKNEKSVLVTLRFPASWKKALERLEKKTGTAKQEYMRMAIREFLQRRKEIR